MSSLRLATWAGGGRTRERLERAALELFTEQGFANTTVPQITARAGLTTRTFFRHFTDKREVLFAGEDDVPAYVAQLTADAPASLNPMTLIVEELQSFAAARFEGRREQLRLRRAVIQADDGLRERELRKISALADAMGTGFRDRGADSLTAALAAQIAPVPAPRLKRRCRRGGSPCACSGWGRRLGTRFPRPQPWVSGLPGLLRFSSDASCRATG